MNPLKELAGQGQSVWLDSIRRSLIDGGGLAELVREDGVTGITSNPAIFQKAITSGADYDAVLAEARRRSHDPLHLYEAVALRDVQDAADLLRPVYERSLCRDGYVSLEVSPYLAADTAGTVAEARRLWKAVARENLMIKVPATPEGIPAIEQLLAEGINVNVTLIFSLAAYERVAEVHQSALETRKRSGEDNSRVASVASFFVSRIDTAVERALAQRQGASGGDPERLLYKVAVASARLAYARFQERQQAAGWQALAAAGALPQRLLWASTSMKSPHRSDVLYVEELIGPDTVNTMPPATLEAFRDHGRVARTLDRDPAGARATLELLETSGISLDRITAELLEEGVHQFTAAFDQLLNALDARCSVSFRPPASRQTWRVPAPLEQQVDAELERWERGGLVRRLWRKDASLWTAGDESRWMGWLTITTEQLARAERFAALSRTVQDGEFATAVLLGMGGSSLGPEVLMRTFGNRAGFPALLVLDSTDPGQIRTLERELDLERTLFVVSSKSGSTLEPNIFYQYFAHRVRERRAARAGESFLAVTDPGSSLEATARADGFRQVFHGVASIGGRYSVLSDFGMVPAAVLGMDVADFLDRADAMAVACSPCIPVRENPGVVLGILLGVLARSGRDKVTLIAAPEIADLGAWLEQLLAESTGKAGKGLIPVDREDLGPPGAYGEDRTFVSVRLAGTPDDRRLDALEAAGHCVIRIELADLRDLGQEFFRWEVATAVAGAVLGIHPFDQPDVEASKVVTRKLTEAFESTGSLPAEEPFLHEGDVALFTDARNRRELLDSAAGRGLADLLRAHLERLGAGDYFALLAYLERNERHVQELQELRHQVRDRKKVATCLGFGPRFLHSTGQAYKGGPATGVFLQVTCADPEDLPVPGQEYTFGVVKAAQARGDFEVLAERGRRALRVHLGPDPHRGLQAFVQAMRRALA